MNQDPSTLMANLAMLQIEVNKLEFRWQQDKAKAQPAKNYVQRLWQGFGHSSAERVMQYGR